MSGLFSLRLYRFDLELTRLTTPCCIIPDCSSSATCGRCGRVLRALQTPQIALSLVLRIRRAIPLWLLFKQSTHEQCTLYRTRVTSFRGRMSSTAFWSNACELAEIKPLETLLDAAYASCSATVR